MGAGATVQRENTCFTVRSPRAESVLLCLFDGDGEQRHAMVREGDNWTCTLPGDLSGTRYGYRAAGVYAPELGLWFDPSKLLVDPCAVALDARFVQDPRLGEYGVDTTPQVPKAIVPARLPVVRKRRRPFPRGGLIYEANVRGLTRLHPDIPEGLRGTVAALAHPAIIAHLRKLRVNAVELMPLIAWIDERHLPPLGLTNAWGYNPVVPMALDPGLCPGGVAELREAVAVLHAAGIAVILDMVLNHTGESDVLGGTLSLRGLDNATYAHGPHGELINDTGTGNTLDFANPAVRRLALDTLRHFVHHCGIDGFRFDLATVLARGPGFDGDAPFFAELAADPVLADCLLIAEPWDVGPGGYQLGRFPPGWLEWNDRFRDDVRRFWRGDGELGALATRMAGSSDLFGKDCRSVNFLAAHDGFTLADTVAYSQRHNLANGEGGRDGHGENFSWNNGIEGPSDDPDVRARRAADLRALLGTLFASTGTIMLTAGDEFGRSQRGNNNAYCQDNAIGWIDWTDRDTALEDYVAGLAARRARRLAGLADFPEGGAWVEPDGQAMQAADWENPSGDGFDWVPPDNSDAPGRRIRRHERQAGFS
ncbi:MAG: glycogen debranching protein GlgX [Sphingomonadales bacterium]|nr:glycogen debranching protein GlgX [Sphingomonadales bacterium]